MLQSRLFPFVPRPNKTCLHAHGEEASVHAAGFQFFGGDLLAVLEEGERLGVANAVYREFLVHLREIQQEAAVKAMRARGPRRHGSESDDDGTYLFRLFRLAATEVQ